MSDAMSMPLGKCVQFLSGGTPSMQKAEYWGGDIPWVSAKDLKTLVLRESQDHLSKLGATSGTRMVGPGAILMLVRGMTLHHDIPICIAGRPLAFNQDIKALIPDEGMIDGRYLLYALLAKKDILLSLVDSAGHGTGRLNTDQLKALPIPLPPLAEQKRIAHILGTLDDKIELNRRMNATLEATARALFQSWFIDFDPVRQNMDRNQPSPGLRPPSPKGRGTSDTGSFELDKATAALFPDSFQDSALGAIPTGTYVAAAVRTVELSQQRYDAGLVAYFDVVDAARTSLDARRAAARLQGQRHLATVALVKALGGDWK